MRDRVRQASFFSKEVFKFNLFKVCIFTIFIMSIFLFKSIFATSNEGIINKMSTKLLSFSFPNLAVGNFSEASISSNLLSYDIFNFKKDIMKKELSCLKAVDYNNGIYNDVGITDNTSKDDNLNGEINESSGSNESRDDSFIDSFILKDSSVKVKATDSIASMSDKKPRVLIYHTHTGEAYYPIGDDPARSRDNNYNVCAVGEKIKSILESKYNIRVVHDITIHDDNYTNSYKKSRETLKQYLSVHGDFDLIIDIHRDSIENKSMAECTVGKEKAAKFMFVMCTENPNYNVQKKLVDKLLKITKEKYPQLLRFDGIFTYKKGIGYYSQDLNTKCLLLECGTNLNTVEEALVTSKYIAEILGKYLITE